MSTRQAFYYLEELEKLGKERVRLTPRLQTLVTQVLDTIAEHAPEGTEVSIPEVGTLKKVVYQTNLGAWPCIVSENYAFTDKYEPNLTFYLNNDFRFRMQNAPRELWLAVANHLPEIAQAFCVEAKKVVEALRGAIAKIEEIAATEV